MKVYLDDKRDCPEGYVIARTMDEAIELFKMNKVEMLSLDHDLGEDDKGNILPTGYDFVKYFGEFGLRADKIYIHTDNVVGREAMYKSLLSFKRHGLIDDDIEVFHYSITPDKYTEL